MKRISAVVKILSGEFLLDFYPNGGTVVFLRSVLTSIILFLLIVVSFGLLKTGFGPEIRWDIVKEVIIDKYDIGCAIFAGCYTVFYTRFSSQWSYLAGVYNQLLNSMVQLGANTTSEQKEALILWKAGILEDACNLHLAAKPMFAPLIIEFLNDPVVLGAFREATIDGDKSLTNIVKMINKRHGISINLPPKSEKNTEAVNPSGSQATLK